MRRRSSFATIGDRSQQTRTGIPNAKASDLRKATERVYCTSDAASAITLTVER